MQYGAFNFNDNKNSGSLIFWFLVIASLVLAITGAILITEVAQLFALPRDWVTTYYKFRTPLGAAVLLMAFMVLVDNFRTGAMGFKLTSLYVFVIGACLFYAHSFAPDFWFRSEHQTAKFISIVDADSLLKDDADIIVLERKGVVRAYPRDWIILPHIAGEDFAGDKIAMSYCALSNLPLAFSSNIKGKPANYKIIAQIDNNLIFADKNSGELIQQITGATEYSKTKLDQFPVQRMPWKSFKTLYPKGKVFSRKPNWLDQLTLKVFSIALPKHYEGKPLFPTLRLEDKRLPNKEQIWGLNIGDEQLAITQNHLKTRPLINTELGGRSIVISWFKDLQTVGVFYHNQNQDANEVLEIDPYGYTPNGQLERAVLYPGVLWMVWSHWFPKTKLLN